MKLIRCRDHGFDCDFEARSEDPEVALKEAAAHANSVHGLEITDEVVEMVKAKIHDV